MRPAGSQQLKLECTRVRRGDRQDASVLKVAGNLLDDLSRSRHVLNHVPQDNGPTRWQRRKNILRRGALYRVDPDNGAQMLACALVHLDRRNVKSGLARRSGEGARSRPDLSQPPRACVIEQHLDSELLGSSKLIK
jgi:hypothetical protein